MRRLSPPLRRGLLVIHLLSSVGWFGGVAAYLALSTTGWTTRDPGLATSCYVGMALVGWRVVVPFSLLATASGVLQAVGTNWGLTRHWWVMLKLLITAFAVAALLLHMGPTDALAEAARNSALGDLEAGARRQLVLAPLLALVLLATNVALGVVKPTGQTRARRRSDASGGGAALA